MLSKIFAVLNKSERLGRRLFTVVGEVPSDLSHVGDVRRLFDVGANIDEVRRLLDAGANVNYSDGQDSVLSMAERSPWGSVEIVRLLLEHGANVNGTQRLGLVSPLLRAAHNSSKDRLRLLIDAGAEVNVIDAFGRTPLLELISWADADSIEYLLAHARSRG